MDEERKKEYESFQEWCLRTYGEGTKSKTIRLHKYKKILSSLRGEIPRSAESSKFRFWVKTKAFRLVDGMLYVPASAGGPLRRVAVVEDFYDIIYGIHVGQGARYGNHAGQKRTYRAVSERFAFLPREAVTRFLLGCSDCQRRLEPETGTPRRHDEYMPINLTTQHCVIQLSVPRTSTPGPASSEEEEDIDISPVSTEGSGPIIAVPDPKDLRISPEADGEEYNGTKNGDVKEEREDWYGLSCKKPCTPQSRELASPVQETGSGHDETSSSGNKDEDEEDDEDDLKSTPHDPERLKAFNMFVRLFVDENLDRIVPISKQPKEKIQAIIDSCQRQFPEFGERARKRIRTYLKSCRRNKRSRDTSFEPARPTPAHLTSAQAEQILATACENEAHNAKRMRLGLEPVAQPMPVLPGTETRAAEHFSPANLCAETKPSVLGNGKDHLARTPEHRPPTSSISSLYRSVPEGPGRPLEPTDLSLRPRLSLHEINSVRRLVAGYRESAAFLLRSADELEQLLLHQ